MKNAGIAGVGRMGRAMARHLINRGFTVTAVDSSREALDAALELGASVADTPAALAAACDVVFIAVGFDGEVEAVCRGGDGVFHGARAETIIVVNSTVSAELVRRLARAYGTNAGSVLEADPGIHFGAGLWQSEVEYLVRREWAMTAADILWRRTKLGLHAPGAAAAIADWLQARGRAA